MVFYRKYRPQKIEELDSKDVRERLFAVLSSKSISHAFLFTGPKGLGKTSAARIVAKAVNCEKKSIEPCNKCHQCISITNGTNLDVLEIDGASNRGIDEIRDLREKVKLSPASASKKIYIIDEVHMLTTEAFNALLKTLEEPPSHVIFVLCTTEPHKVPLTITSRCLHIPFKRAINEELVRSFKRIVEREKIDIDNDALYLIASLSDGSFRDGAKILEEMALLANGRRITKEFLEQKYQISNIKYQISEMIECLSKKDSKQGLKLVAKLVEQGVDMKYFIEQLIAELHFMLLREVGVDDARGPVKESSKFKVQSLKLSIEGIRELVELLTRAYGELKYAVLPQLPLEMVIIEWSLGSLGSPHPLNDSSIARGPVAPSSHPMSSSRQLAGLRALDGTPSSRAIPRLDNVKSPRVISDFWHELINKVKAHNHSIAGVLRGCTLKEYDNKKLIIETGYKFHKERLDDGKTKAIIEKVSREIAGEPVAVSVILKIKN